jgi:hypothetical protein
MLADPKIHSLLTELKGWPGTVLNSHKSASQLFHKLAFIADLGLDVSDPPIKKIVNTVIRTGQCLYIENGSRDILSCAKEKGMRARSVELKTAQEEQEQSPSAYGVFGTVLDGQLPAYQYLLQKDFDNLLQERSKGD